jgi:hypothetical protein
MISLHAAWARLESGPRKAEALHDVLHLDVVHAAGQPPTGYGWHVDSLLNVRLQSVGEPPRPATEPPLNQEDPGPPEQSRKAKIYRVPRTRRHPKLRLLAGGLPGDAA